MDQDHFLIQHLVVYRLCVPVTSLFWCERHPEVTLFS